MVHRETSIQIAENSILRSRIAGERIISIIRLILLIPFTLFVAPLLTSEAVNKGFWAALLQPQFLVEISSFILVAAYSVWILNRLKQNRYNNSFKYITPAIEITLLNIIVFLNAASPREGLILTGAPTFIYFIFLVLSVLRNSPASVIFTGAYIIISYLALSASSMFSLSIFDETAKIFSSHIGKTIQIDVDDEIYKLLIILTTTGLCAYVAKRFNDMVSSQIKSSIERERLREMFFENVKEVSGNLFSAGKELSLAYSVFLGKIEGMIKSSRRIEGETHEEHRVVEITSRTVGEIIHSIGKVSENIVSQAHHISETVSAIEEMSGSIRMITDTSQRASSVAGNLLSAARVGGDTVNEVYQAIMETEQESKKIEEIVEIISGIAGTTNLLSMNAAIEAAHAGEAGKGFAVIAEEIGKLAETSGANANQIAEILKDIYERIRNIGSLAQNANARLDAIVSDARQTTEINSTMRSAMEEELKTINDMTISLHSLNKITEDVKNASAIQSEGGSGLLDSITKLKSQADNVLSLINSQMEEFKAIDEISQALNAAVLGNEKTANKLEDLVKKI